MSQLSPAQMATAWSQRPTDGAAADDWFGANAPSPNTGVTGYAPGGVQAPPVVSTPQTWDQNTFTQMFGTPGTPEELAALEPKLNAAGIKVSRNAAGVAGKIILPNGQYVDVINSAGAGGKGFQWLTGDGGAPNAAAGGAQAPYNFSTDDPSYQWRVAQGLKALQGSAAANGTLLTGGTLKDILNYGQGAASQEYQNAFGRKYNLAGLGLSAAQIGSNTASAYGQNSANLATGQGNANAASTIVQGNNNANTIGGLAGVGAGYAPQIKNWLGGVFGGNKAQTGYQPSDQWGWG